MSGTVSVRQACGGSAGGGRLLGGFHLGTVEPGIHTVGVQQVVVCAHLRDAACVEDDEPVGAAERREPMGDGDRRPPGHQPVDRCLDDRLSLSVDTRRSLVENQNPRIDEEGAGNREPLSLAT